MSKMLKVLIGASIGGSIGYFIGAVICEVMWLKEHADDFEYEDLDEDPGNDDETNLEEKGIVEKMSKPKRRVKNYTEYFEKQGRPDIAALINKYNNQEVPEEPQEEVVEEEYEVDLDIPTDPSIISMEEYANSEGYETLTFEYFDDGVVIDENKNPIHRYEEILGEEFETMFGHLSHDSDVVYVKNEKKKAMYEIIRTNLEYAPEQPRKQRPDRIDRMGEEQRNEPEENT